MSTTGKWVRPALLVACSVVAWGCQEQGESPSRAPNPVQQSSPNKSVDVQQYETQINELNRKIQDAQAAAARNYSQGWNAGYDQGYSDAYPYLFSDLGEVYLIAGDHELTDAKIELNYKAPGGGYFDIVHRLEAYHLLRIPKVKFVDENGRNMSSEQKVVSLRVKGTQRGKQIEHEGSTFDVGAEDK
jgi:hypothetical protein